MICAAQGEVSGEEKNTDTAAQKNTLALSATDEDDGKRGGICLDAVVQKKLRGNGNVRLGNLK